MKLTLYFFYLLVVFFAIFSTYRLFFVKAETAYFYPTACLGGWANPHNAENEPSGKDAILDETNSASIGNSVADIFCGSFKGEIPKDTLPKTFYLKLAWSLGQNKVSPDTISNTASVIEAISSPMDESTTSTTTMTTTLDEATTTETPVIPDVVEPAVVEPTPVETSPATDAPQSILWNKFIPIAYADDNLATDTVATRTEIATTTASSTEVNVGNNPPFIIISYTLDGISWKPLTVINSATTQNTFELPPEEISTWNDLSNLQIKISRIATVDDEPEVFLDGMSVNVDYTPEIKKPIGLISDQKRFNITDIKSSDDGLLLLSEKNDGDQGNILVSRAYAGGAVYFYNLDDQDFFMTEGVGTDPVEFPAYQFTLGHYVIFFSPDSKDCNGKNLLVCMSIQGFVEKGTFTIQASSETPTEFLAPIVSSTTTISTN